MQELKTYKAAKAAAIAAILDSDKRKLDKLRLIAEHKLMPLAYPTPEPFTSLTPKEYETEDLFSPHVLINIDGYRRYQHINFHDYISNAFEGCDENTLIPTHYKCTDNNSCAYITVSSAIDMIYDYVIKNNVIGFEIDWRRKETRY